MSNKVTFLICAVITSVIGLTGGFIVTKSIAMSKSNTASALNSIKQEPLKTEEIPNYSNENKIEIKEPEVVPQKEVEKPKPVVTNPCPKPKKDYIDETYLDVGQGVALEDASYIPSDLVKLDKSTTRTFICVKEEVAEALKSMLTEANKDGYTIMVSSGFRDYATQKSIVDRETKNGNTNVSVAVAKPGYSEHQLGVAVDLTSKSIAYASATGKFGDTPESTWLEEHASEYGFIESYPKGKEDITGYMYEPWHYRYVGIENATEIIKSGLTVNEYMKAKKVLSLKEN